MQHEAPQYTNTTYSSMHAKAIRRNKTKMEHLPGQDLPLRSASQALAYLLVLCGDVCTCTLCFLSRRPYFPALLFLLLVVFRDGLPHRTLEKNRCLLPFWVKQAVRKNPPIQVGLLAHAENFVFVHDASIWLADGFESLFGGVFVAIDFVSHLGVIRAVREEFLHHYEGFCDRHGCVGEIVRAVGVKACLDLLGLGFAMVLDVAVLQIAIEGFKIEKRRNIGMGRGAVVTLVEIVGQNLPVVCAVYLVGVV